MLKLNNYTYVGTEHCNKKGGGVGFLIRKNLIIRDRADLQINSTTFEHHIIELKCRKRNILLVSLYCPPNTSVKSFHDEYKELLNKLNEVTSCDVILGLDHNLDFLKSNNHKDTQNFIELNLEKKPCCPVLLDQHELPKSTTTLIDNTLISKNLQGRQDSKTLNLRYQ